MTDQFPGPVPPTPIASGWLAAPPTASDLLVWSESWRYGWRPAIFTKRQHFVPSDTEPRRYQSAVVAPSLCDMPGYLTDDRTGQWWEWPKCSACMAWLPERQR